MGPKETREKNTNHLREPFFIIIFFWTFILFIYFLFFYLFIFRRNYFNRQVLLGWVYFNYIIFIFLFLFLFLVSTSRSKKKKQVVQQLYYKAEVLVWSLKETRRLTETKNCITNDRTQKRNKRVSKGWWNTLQMPGHKYIQILENFTTE